MATFDKVCLWCDRKFKAKSPAAKWCQDNCRQAKLRADRKAVIKLAIEEERGNTPSPLDDHGLVVSVREELTAVNRLKTFHGQLALQLAKRMADPEESGVASMSKELRSVMAKALDGAKPVGQTPVEDEVEKARRIRDETRKTAGVA